MLEASNCVCICCNTVIQWRQNYGFSSLSSSRPVVRKIIHTLSLNRGRPHREEWVGVLVCMVSERDFFVLQGYKLRNAFESLRYMDISLITPSVWHVSGLGTMENTKLVVQHLLKCQFNQYGRNHQCSTTIITSLHLLYNLSIALVIMFYFWALLVNYKSIYFFIISNEWDHHQLFSLSRPITTVIAVLSDHKLCFWLWKIAETTAKSCAR